MKETQTLHVKKNVVQKSALIRQKEDFVPVKKGRFGTIEYGILAVTFILLFSSIYAVYLLQPEFEHLHWEQMNSSVGIVVIGIGLFLLSVAVCFLVYLLVLYLRYKPIASVTDDQLPTCTIIVPAYNEGKLVYETLHSLASSDYPEEKYKLLR